MTRRIVARGGLSVVVLVIMLAAFSAPITAQVPEEFTNLEILPEDFDTGLLRADDLPGALAALELNVELYPEAWNSWALQGQVHMRSDQTEEAIAAFERSLELLPGNPRVLQVLERLKGGGD